MGLMPRISFIPIIIINMDAPYIIFFSSYPQYMLSAFDVGAFNFIVKPINEEEFDMLHYFMVNKRINLSHGQILRRVWGDEYADSSRALLYSRLRRELQPKPIMPDYITTIRKFGYVFAPE